MTAQLLRLMLDTNVFDALYASGLWRDIHRLHGQTVQWLTTTVQEQELQASPNGDLRTLPRDVWPPADQGHCIEPDQLLARTALAAGAVLVTDDKALQRWCCQCLPRLQVLSSAQLISRLRRLIVDDRL